MDDRAEKKEKRLVPIPIPSSYVSVYGEVAGPCGYCKPMGLKKRYSPETSISYGVVSERMLGSHYEQLMLKGWRRSGTYLYKPVMHKTCCPAYSIRLNVEKFRPSKSQRQTLRKMERYLSGGFAKADTAMDMTLSTSCNNDKKAKTSMSSSNPAIPAHTLTVETLLPECTDERFTLYCKYQAAVHGDDEDDLTVDGFTRFLVTTPLHNGSSSSSGSNNGSSSSGSNSTYPIGSYHQLYRLDGTLVAVGVVDILSSGLSSVYLFYDPDFKFLELGKYSALYEIEFCQENRLAYYYMGYYIQKCPKMRYKSIYEPSELLCPVSMEWHPLSSEIVSLLDHFKFSPFNAQLLSLREKVTFDNDYFSRAPHEVAENKGHAPLDMSDAEERGNNSASSSKRGVSALFEPRIYWPGKLVGDAEVDPNGAPLDIGAGRLFRISDLNATALVQLSPLLKGWLKVCGEDLGRSIVIKLC